MDVYVSPDIGMRLAVAREFLGLSPEAAAQGMRNRLEASFERGLDILEFERGGFMSYMSILRNFADLYHCDVDDLLTEKPWESESWDSQAPDMLAHLSDDDREMLLRFHHFLQRAGRPPEIEAPS